MSAGVVLLYLLYLLILCLTISRFCWYGISLSAMPAGVVLHNRSCLLVWYPTISHEKGVVPHYRQCLLVWCLTVGHVFWCGASLKAMSVGWVPHYRPCLLVRFAFQPTFWLDEGSGMATSVVLLLQRCHYIRHVC